MSDFPKWEYKSVSVYPAKLEDDHLNALGDEGWELVGFSSYRAWFKRSLLSTDKPSPPPNQTEARGLTFPFVPVAKA